MRNILYEVISRRSLRSRLQIARTWRLVWRSTPLWTTVNGAFVLIDGLLPLLSLYLLKQIIDAFAMGIGEHSGDAFATGCRWIVVFAGVSAIAALLKAVDRLVSEAQAGAVTDHVQAIVQAKAMTVDLEDYENPEYHDLLQQVQSQSTFRPGRIARGVFTGVRSLVSGLALGSLLFSYSWLLGIILLVFALPGVMVRLRYAHRLLEWFGRQSARHRFSSYFHGLLTGAAFAKEIRLFGLGDILRDRATHLRSDLRTERLRLESRRSLLELVPNLCSVAALLLSFWMVGQQTIQGRLTLGDMVIYYQAFQRCQTALSEFLNATVNFYEDNLFLAIFYRFLDLQPKVMPPALPLSIPGCMQTGLALEGVSFRYPGTSRDVLKDLSLTIPPGEVLALVGENGAGKSTLTKLICRLYDPTRGRITLDGIDIREFDIAEYRNRIGAVFQDFNQYNLTARENIWFGNVTLPRDDPGIIDAAVRAGIHGTIAGLTNGYDTILGREFRAGEQLSDGQWQRVALARALYRGSQILILDEPTSAMDPKAESEMFQAIQTLSAGRTTLLISHRLSTVTMADRICVLDHGRIAEIGRHQELCDRRGIYAGLFERQSRAYRYPEYSERS